PPTARDLDGPAPGRGKIEHLMDLHFTADEPTAEEAAAVDGCLAQLCPAAPAMPADARRQHLLPVLHALQGRVGWISPGALNHACRRLEVAPAEAYGVADFYALFQTRPHPPVAIHVCDDIGCSFLHGDNAELLCADLERRLGPPGASPDGVVTWHRSPCLGLCERAPAALVLAPRDPPREQAVAPATAEALLAAAEAGGGRGGGGGNGGGWNPPPMDVARSVPQLRGAAPGGAAAASGAR